MSNSKMAPATVNPEKTILKKMPVTPFSKSRPFLPATYTAHKKTFSYIQHTGMIDSAYIIDDDEISTLLSATMLEEFSRSLRCFSSAEAAFTGISDAEESKVTPFVIFLDLNMPQMDGWGFLEAMSCWGEELRERCRVVILSSSINRDEIQRSGDYKAVINFISKPLDEHGLSAVINLLH